MVNMYMNTPFSFQEIEDCSNGKKYLVTVKIPMSIGWIDDVLLYVDVGERTYEIPLGHVGNDSEYASFSNDLFLENRYLYSYYFSFKSNDYKYFITKNGVKSSVENYEKFKESVGFSVPDWAKGAIMYHIFVDRFNRGSKKPLKKMDRRDIHESWNEDVVLGDNPKVKHYGNEEVWNVDFFGGDIEGIIQKLDYLQSLGVTVLYLSPIFESPSTHRYDTIDYEKIDPYLGSWKDFKRFTKEAHKRGMKIILDLVFNHTSDESKYFDRYGKNKDQFFFDQGSYNNPYSKYYPFYRYVYKDGQEKNTYWWEFKTMPELDSSGEFWKKYLCGKKGIIDRVYSYGVDAVRLDVPENIDDIGLQWINEAVKRNSKEPFIIGEVWENPMRKGRTLISADRMHTTMNYHFIDAVDCYFKYQDPYKLSYIIKDINAEYADDTIHSLMNFTSTHDVSRKITLLGIREFDPNQQFSSLPVEVQRKIYDGLHSLGYMDDDIMSLFNGYSEITYYSFQKLMEYLLKHGVSSKMISYLKGIFHYSPFDPNGSFTKDIYDDVKKDLDFVQNYILTSKEYEKALEKYKAYLLFLYSWPGMVSIYYGDEVGMQGLDNLTNRRPYPWSNPDCELITYFQKLGNYRKSNPIIKETMPQILELDSDFMLFEYNTHDHKMLIGLNNSDSSIDISIPSIYNQGEEVFSLNQSKKKILTPYGGIVIKK